jgi:dTDP-4-amino-4,6-dideoxygalactose transaminase
MIHTADPDLSGAEVEAVTEAMREGTLSTGELVSEFEDQFASYVGREHGAAVCSGSVALEFALEALDLSSNAGVIISPRNCASVLYSVLNTGLVPVYADVKANGVNIGTEGVERALKRSDCHVEAILATHLHGTTSDVDGLVHLAEKHDLELVEDICQCPGAMYRGEPAGSFGSVAVCSFGATKNLTTAEGGMVVCDDLDLIERIRLRRSSRHGEASEPLSSVRMNDLEAAIGIEQLNRYGDIVGQRQKIAKLYDNNLPDTVTTPQYEPDASHVYLNYPLFVDDPTGLSRHLQEHDIQTAQFDKLLSEYDCSLTSGSRRYPNAQRIIDEGLVLPIHSNLSESDAIFVAESVMSYY